MTVDVFNKSGAVDIVSAKPSLGMIGSDSLVTYFEMTLVEIN